MARSAKAVPWFLFAAGGTVLSFVLPVLIIITGIAPALGIFSGALAYDTMHEFLSYWVVKLAIFGIVFFALWHAAHRIRVCAHDFGLRADGTVAIIVYSLAAFGTLAVISPLLRI